MRVTWATAGPGWLDGMTLAPLGGTAAAEDTGSRGYQVAVLGDTPYGDDQRLQFPALVDTINADPQVRLVLHAGDVKSGSTTCDDARFRRPRGAVRHIPGPVRAHTWGQDWTDCHRVNNGAHNPLERHHVVFATVHVVGSENSLAPWSGLGLTTVTPEQQAEFDAREAANLEWIGATFDDAVARDAAGVLLMMQAEPLESVGFVAVRERILQRAAEFGQPVLLVHGDEHVYEVEPLYGGVADLTRLETFGATATEWLRLTVDPTSETVFSWTPEGVTP